MFAQNMILKLCKSSKYVPTVSPPRDVFTLLTLIYIINMLVTMWPRASRPSSDMCLPTLVGAGIDIYMYIYVYKYTSSRSWTMHPAIGAAYLATGVAAVVYPVTCTYYSNIISIPSTGGSQRAAHQSAWSSRTYHILGLTVFLSFRHDTLIPAVYAAGNANWLVWTAR